MIPFNKPQFDEKEYEAVKAVLDSGHLTAGKEVEAFEKEFAEYIGAPYVVAVDNCTNALFLSLYYDNWIKELKDKWIKCPAMTFASVAHSIVHSSKFSQLIFTDEYYAGEKYQLAPTNIWDCAHQIERGMYEKGQIQCFSFYPNKVLSSAEGGAIATDDKDFAEWAKQAREMGRVRKTYADYDINFTGWKMNMTDIQAAIAREQLKKLDGFLEKRENIRKEYDKYFTQINHWHYLYVIKVENRRKFIDRMKDEGVEISYHYKPLYDQPAYSNYKGNFPHTESIKDNIVTLPLYPSLKDEELEQIIQLTKKYQYEA